MNNYRVCSISNCGKPVKSRGLCNAHYTRQLRHGDVMEEKAVGTSNGECMRFIREVVLNHDGDECLAWPYSRAKGYGHVWLGEKMIYAHRYVCTLVHGEPPSEDHQCAHSCGNGHLGCVAKNHLRWATQSENMADRVIHAIFGQGENWASLDAPPALGGKP